MIHVVHMTPRDASPQSELRRNLQTLMTRKSDTPDSGSPVVDSSLQNPDFPNIYCESGKDVDAYKGTLLGVEDELIDALNIVVYSNPAVNQQFPESPTSCQFYSRPTCRLPDAREELIDALASLQKQVSDDFISPQSSGLPACCNLRSEPGFAGHERRSITRSNTVSPTFWNPWAADLYDDRFSSDSNEENSRVHCEASVAMASRDIEPRWANCSTAITPCFCTQLPPAKDSGPLEASATFIALDGFVVGLSISERPIDMSQLSTWDLHDWQGTISDLLLVDNEGDASRESIVSN